MKTVSLEAISDSIRYGYTASATLEPLGPKFLRITDIVPSSISWGRVPYCKIEEKNLEKYALKPGDIVVARTGATVGYAKLIRDPVEAVFASYLVRFRLDPEVADPYFVGKLIESQIYKDYVWSRINGAAQPNASAPVLGSFSFNLPELFEQRLIAEFLENYDQLIVINQRRITLLEEAARRIYREWFVHLRFPGHESVPVTDGIPRGWEWLSLGEVAEITMGQSPQSKHYNTDGDGLPFHQGVSDFGDRFVTHRTFTKQATRIAQSGDILCSVRAPVGRLNITRDKIAIGRGLSAMRSRSGNQALLFYQLANLFVEEDLIGGGAIFASVAKKELFGQPILQPDARIANLFDRLVCDLNRQIETLDSHNRALTSARDLLLPRLTSGQLDVSVLPNPEEVAA